MIAQYNKYTTQYYLNQRFIIGTRQAYKLVGIYESGTLSTNDPADVGIVRLHLEIDQVGDKDDLERRIAFNGVDDKPVPVTPDTPVEADYALTFEEPNGFPETFEEILVWPVVKNGDQITEIPVTTTFSLTGRYADKANINNYVTIE